MSELMISNLTEIIMCAVTCGVGIFFAFIGRHLQKSSTLKLALDELESAVVAVCAQLQTQLVEKWKQSQDGKLTPKQVDDLGTLTKELTIRTLTPALLDAVMAAGIDLDAKITALQEKSVRSMK